MTSCASKNKKTNLRRNNAELPTSDQTPHLGQLGLQVLHLGLQAPLLAQGGAEAGVLAVEQSLLVPQPGQSRLQLRLLLAVPAERKTGEVFFFTFSFLTSFKMSSVCKNLPADFGVARRRVWQHFLVITGCFKNILSSRQTSC